MQKLETKDYILLAMFAALTAVLAQIIIPLPFSPVPISLATLSIFVAGGLLGGVKGGLSQLVYVLLGAIGLPVFAGMNGGFGVIAGPTGGYLLGYVAGAFVIGILKFPKVFWGYALSMVFGICVCYTIGTVWYTVVMGTTFVSALMMCVVPFIPGDILKICLAALLVMKLKKVIQI